jgi:hypothetical protein
MRTIGRFAARESERGRESTGSDDTHPVSAETTIAETTKRTMALTAAPYHPSLQLQRL